MRANPQAKSRRSLQLLQLESRDVPAQVNFIGNTLTINADEGDTITLSRSSAAFGGLVVEDGSGIEFSTSSSRDIPRHVVVNLNKANSATLNITGSTDILGNLTINGAKGTSTVNASTHTVYGNFNYLTKTAGNDTLNVLATIFGNATINMGNGSNSLYLRGTVHQSLNVLAGNGSDTVRVGGSSTTDPLRVFGNCRLNLGPSANALIGEAGGLRVGGNFSYTGGAGFDEVDFPTPSRLSIGGNSSFTVGSGGSLWDTAYLDIGGSYTLLAGDGDDEVWLRDETSIGGKLSITHGNGENNTNLATLRNSFRVGGSFTYSGGKNVDDVRLNNGDVGGSVSISVGNNDSTMTQQASVGYLGPGASGIVRIGGNVTLTGGSTSDVFNFVRATIGGGLTCRGLAGDDTLKIDDTSVGGATAIWFGSGNDVCRFDTADNYAGSTRFSGPVQLWGGSGDDVFNFAASGGQFVIFGQRVVVDGGSGSDLLSSYSENIFFRLNNSQNCELGGF